MSSAAAAGCLLALAASLACTAALPHATPPLAQAAKAQWPGTTVADLERGRTLYVRRCSGCHNLYLAEAYGAEEWPALVGSMSARARLAPDERRDVTRFLVTLSRERR